MLTAQHVFDWDDAPIHSFPACSARSDGHVIHLALRDGSHVRADRVVFEHKTTSGRYDLRTTVARHLDNEARASVGSDSTKSLAAVRPWKTKHEPSLVALDPRRPFGPTNVTTKPIRPSIAYCQSPCSSALLVDPGAHLPPRSLASRTVDTPASSPWTEPTPPPDRLSFAVRADQQTGRTLRRSKSTSAERTIGGMPFSLKARTTAAYGLDAVIADLQRLGGDATLADAEDNFRKGRFNAMGAPASPMTF